MENQQEEYYLNVKMNEMRHRIKRIMDFHPKVCKDGYGINYDAKGFTHPIFTGEKFETSRSALLRDSSVKEFIKCDIWYHDNIVKWRLSINTKMTSYGIKHIIERYMDKVYPKEDYYVSNGVCILYFLSRGYKIRPYENSINVFFNISSKSLKE